MHGLGNNLNELKLRISKAREELERMSSSISPLPEMIDSTNILRQNEHLIKVDKAKSNLIISYEEYTKQLEDLALSLLSIQSDLKDIVTTEASILLDGSGKKPRKPNARKKSKK
jgi:hypothetical protein